MIDDVVVSKSLMLLMLLMSHDLTPDSPDHVTSRLNMIGHRRQVGGRKVRSSQGSRRRPALPHSSFITRSSIIQELQELQEFEELQGFWAL